MAQPDLPPALLLAYKRVETTKRVIDALREVRVPRVYFAVDGPKKGEESACEAVRNLTEKFDWECEVTTHFRHENSGLRDSVESSISWFFSHVDEGVILEDDCLPGSDFFQFSKELLECYRGDPRVMHISGSSHETSFAPHSYRVSRYPHVWGWATWSEAWESYMQSPILTRSCFRNLLLKRFEDHQERTFWLLIFDCVASGKIDTWDYSWLFYLMANDGLSITPAENMISNIGFGELATHTTEEDNPHANKPIASIAFPLSHPEKLHIDLTKDREVANGLFRINRSARAGHAKLRLTKFLPKSTKQWIERHLVNRVGAKA
ncbi:MAG: hypothetical protein AAF357_12920 [Verrucomicrobiota bacterium]